VLYLPTATDKTLGVNAWGGGPAFIALTIDQPWLVGAVANNVWAWRNRQQVDEMTLQYFINYNLPDGWYLIPSRSSPPIGERRRTTSGSCRLEAESGACSRSASSPSTRKFRGFTMRSDPRSDLSPAQSGRRASSCHYYFRREVHKRNFGGAPAVRQGATDESSP
jgi:hypothetical protein